MIDWVESQGRTWGAVMRNRMFESGFASESTIYQLLSGRSGFRQYFPEVMMPADVLRFHHAMMALRTTHEQWFSVLCGGWVMRQGQRRVAHALNLKHDKVRAIVHQSHGWLAGRIEQVEDAC